MIGIGMLLCSPSSQNNLIPEPLAPNLEIQTFFYLLEFLLGFTTSRGFQESPDHRSN